MHIRGGSGTAQVIGNPPKIQVHVDFHGDQFLLDDTPDGSFEVICDLDPAHAKDIGELGNGAFENQLHPTHGTWTFDNEEDVIVGDGYAGIFLNDLRRGGVEMFFSDTLTVTSGCGKYHGAAGQITSLGWAQVEGLPPPGSSFSFQMIHIFGLLPLTVVAAEREAEAPSAGGFPAYE